MCIRKALMAGAILAAATLGMGGHAAAQSVSLSAVLLGGNECDGTAPPAGPICRKGDPDAFGRATITFPTATTICVTLQVDNLAGATAAHIHSGRETVNGPIVFALPAPVAPGGANPGVSAICGTPPAGLPAALRANPANFYINVHNGAFVGGARRGLLF
jgi:hypothetical protein